METWFYKCIYYARFGYIENKLDDNFCESCYVHDLFRVYTYITGFIEVISLKLKSNN